MRLKYLIAYFIIFVLPISAQAQEYHHHYLTLEQIQRVRVVKDSLSGVNTQSVMEMIKDLEKSRYPEINLEIKEAEAHAFNDIVVQQDVQDQHKKQWLYSMVCLNMAYLQFSGTAPGSNTTSLNMLIRQELQKYLPAAVLNKSGFLYSLS